MESHRKLDLARLAVCALILSGTVLAQVGRELDRGVALAQIGRLDEARSVLLAARQLKPSDSRFPVELGGIAFKQKRYAEAAKWLKIALRLNPDDAYANDFLGTIYFLQGNLEAALKYWNRIGKPQIVEVKTESALRIDPVLLDRAFKFAPSSTLLLTDLRATRARVGELGVFPAFNIRLAARENGKFDALFTAQERNGWGTSKTQALISTFRGLGYQTIYPEYFNLGQSAINVESLLRWDPQKRRLAASVSAPLREEPGRRYRFGLDLRNENWDLRGAPLKLYRSAVSGEVSIRSVGGWTWSTGGEVSLRDYRSLLVPSLKAYQLKHLIQVNRELLRVPDRRFESNLKISSEAGRIWSAPSHSFEKLQGSLSVRWFPQMAGEDYAISQQFRTGATLGQAPFDELFILGLERDNDLWMRAHPGTRDGRKGSAPMGRNYYLSNSTIDKEVFTAGFIKVKLSPFLDVGKIQGFAGLGSGKWLWDTGVETKIRVFGVGFSLIYGKDMRTGGNSLYLTAAR